MPGIGDFHGSVTPSANTAARQRYSPSEVTRTYPSVLAPRRLPAAAVADLDAAPLGECREAPFHLRPRGNHVRAVHLGRD